MNKNYFFQEILVKNPVLIGMVGLCPIVAICTSLKSALIMSVITILTLVLAQILATLVFKHLPQWLRMGLYTLVGMIVVVPAILIIEKFNPATMLAFGIYLPLLAVNPIIVRQCEREGVKATLGNSILSALCASLGYSVVLIIVGFFRELLGAGAVWDHKIAFISPAKAFLMPMGGFLILSYLAAALRAYFKKLDPEFSDDISLRSKALNRGERKADTLFGEKARGGKPKKSQESKKEKPASKVQVVTLEQAEEEKAKTKPPVELTIQSELAETKPLPSNAKVTHKTAQFEFITLDLSNEERTSEEAEAFARAVAESTAVIPQKQKTKRNQKKKVKGERANAPRQNRKTIPLPAEKASEEKEVSKAEVTSEEKPTSKIEATPKKKMPSKSDETSENKETPVNNETPKSKEATKDLTEEAPKKPDKKSDSAQRIVYKTAELEKLMSMSLDDIINSLPDSDKGDKDK